MRSIAFAILALASVYTRFEHIKRGNTNFPLFYQGLADILAIAALVCAIMGW